MADKLTADWVAKNGEKVKEAYRFATLNKYDIKSENDVLEILKVIDTKNANPEYAKLLSKMLLMFRLKFRETLKKRVE